MHNDHMFDHGNSVIFDHFKWLWLIMLLNMLINFLSLPVHDGVVEGVAVLTVDITPKFV